jgi:hypothetical protein
MKDTETMTEYTNSYGVTYKVGQTGRWYQKFRKEQRDDVLTIVSFTPSGKFMRASSTVGTYIYLFSTENCILRGSHMGNSSIAF